MVKKKGKTTEKPEPPMVQKSEPVVTVSEATPESPDIETEETKETATSENRFTILKPVIVPEDKQDEIVTVKVTHGSVGILGLGIYEAGETFQTTRLRASQLDQRFIKLV